MRIGSGWLLGAFASLLLSFAVQLQHAAAQTTPNTNSAEIPLQRCDRLPVVIIQVNDADKRFLIDTAATSMLNEKSFASGHSKEIRVQSWNQTIALSARVVSIGELKLGSHILRGVTLPAIDLTALAKACGDPLDGVLGVDLLEQLGVTMICSAASRASASPRPVPRKFPSSRKWNKPCIPARKRSTTRTPRNSPPASIRISSSVLQPENCADASRPLIISAKCISA
jgi:hypothetical protein